MAEPSSLGPKVAGEFVGTAFLLASIVGSGAMAQRLTDDVGLQLLQNAIATAAALFALIVTFGTLSGAHFNPAVTLSERLLGRLDNRTLGAYIVAQIGGGGLGVVAANVMFEFDPIYWSTNDRFSWAQVFSEVIATIGLLLVIHGVGRDQSLPVVAAAVATYLAGAYAFTSSTSFANPAVTVARTLTDTFAGIKPSAAPPFVIAQVGSTFVAVGLVRMLFPAPAAQANAGLEPIADADNHTAR